MVTERVCDDLELAAGATSSGYMIDLSGIGASGDFGLEVVSDDAVEVWYKASADDDTPGSVSDESQGILAEHAGSGKKLYWPSIMPASKIWVYVTDGGAGGTVSITLNVW